MSITANAQGSTHCQNSSPEERAASESSNRRKKAGRPTQSAEVS